jgi:hypothetical protein
MLHTCTGNVTENFKNFLPEQQCKSNGLWLARSILHGYHSTHPALARGGKEGNGSERRLERVRVGEEARGRHAWLPALLQLALQRCRGRGAIVHTRGGQSYSRDWTSSTAIMPRLPIPSQTDPRWRSL